VYGDLPPLVATGHPNVVIETVKQAEEDAEPLPHGLRSLTLRLRPFEIATLRPVPARGEHQTQIR